MTDARAKGARGETVARDMLRKHTGLQWERTPGSGALDEKHMLKGDLYVPNEKNRFCVEVKNYADDHLTSVLLSSKSPQLIAFWAQAERQGEQIKREPLLIFKFNRSKLFVAWNDPNYMPTGNYPYMYVERDGFAFFCALLEDWLLNEIPKFIS